MEEASSSGAKATELRAKLDAEIGEHGETKMRLQSETAANAGLRDAVLETNEVRFFFLHVRFKWVTSRNV